VILAGLASNLTSWKAIIGGPVPTPNEPGPFFIVAKSQILDTSGYRSRERNSVRSAAGTRGYRRYREALSR
jgi:hypothetical protein